MNIFWVAGVFKIISYLSFPKRVCRTRPSVVRSFMSIGLFS